MDTAIVETVAQIFRGGSAIVQDPYPIFAQVREKAPLFRAPVFGPVPDVHVTRYADVYAALRDPRLSSERPHGGIPLQIEGGDLSAEDKAALAAFERVNTMSMLTKDPPDHTRLRKLVARAFSPRVVEQQRPMVQAIVNDLLAQASRQEGVDLIRAVAAPLPAQVIAALLGVPQEDWSKFKQWSDGVISFDRDAILRSARNTARLDAYFRDMIAARREEPREDMLSALVRARDEQGALTEDEMVVQCIVLLTGGHETTTQALGSTLATLAKQPEVWQELREHPGLVPGIVDECLRLESPFQFNNRVAREDLEIAGQPIRKGEFVWLWVAAANRDPRQFDLPDLIDPHRSGDMHLSHLAFGGGIHYCLGAALAQLELRTALTTLTQRYPDFRVIDAPVRWRDNVALRGPSALHVSFGHEPRAY
jgi:pimeloyl-[acyl-carrier protein] synthase